VQGKVLLPFFLAYSANSTARRAAKSKRLALSKDFKLSMAERLLFQMRWGFPVVSVCAAHGRVVSYQSKSQSCKLAGHCLRPTRNVTRKAYFHRQIF
jgi:hypothetical protein